LGEERLPRAEFNGSGPSSIAHNRSPIALFLTLAPMVLVFLGIDPNYGQVILGHVDCPGSDDRRRIHLSTSANERDPPLRSGNIRSMRLILLLVAFVIGVEIVRPGTVTPIWVSNPVLLAAPLAIMAGAQTLVMLTGGIDLSVASVATGAAYLLATNACSGVVPAISLALLVGVIVGIIKGIRVALLCVQPLVMTLGAGLMTGGMLRLDAGAAGVQTLRWRQSSNVAAPLRSMWSHTTSRMECAPNSCVDRTPVQAAKGSGGRQRNGPIGGAA
jgi:hypothetical protein